MHYKFLASLILLTAFAIPGRAQSEEMECFKNVGSYMTKRFGAEYKQDDNLIVRPRRHGSQLFTEVKDATSGTNSESTLLRPFPQRGLCVVLKGFPLIGLEVIKKDKAGRPLEIMGQDQASGTTGSNEIIYTLTKSGVYKATRCRRLMFNKSGPPLAADVPCGWVLGQRQ